MYYIFYNPVYLPISVQMPLRSLPELSANTIGCRIVPRGLLDPILATRSDGYSPTFGDLEDGLSPEIQGVPSIGGWRLEDFAADLVLKCKVGLVDESPNFESLVILMNQKQRPMSCALSITFDVQD